MERGGPLSVSARVTRRRGPGFFGGERGRDLAAVEVATPAPFRPRASGAAGGAAVDLRSGVARFGLQRGRGEQR